MHCPSCVSAITSILTAPPVSLSPRAISISLLSHRVTISHARDQLKAAATALIEAGYDLVDPDSPHDALLPIPSTSQLESRWWESKARRARRQKELEEGEVRRAEKHRESCRACREGTSFKGKEKDCAVSMEQSGSGEMVSSLLIEGMTCASCVGAVERLLMTQGDDHTRDVVVTLLPPRAVIRHGRELNVEELVDRVEDGGYGASLLDSKPVKSKDAAAGWTESAFVIDGMTCSSCVGSLKSSLDPATTAGIRSSTVTLLPPRAIIIHDPNILTIDQLVDMIEEGGYGAELVNSSPVDGLSSGTLRDVKLRVEGMFCDKCSAALNGLLETLQTSGDITSFTPLSLSNPVTTLKYTPRPPLGFTLRTLDREVTSLGPFTLSVIHPSDTLDALARRSHARESRAIGLRFGVTLLFAIPTFFISVIAMSLLPASSPLRQRFSAPTWGSASLGTLILFALATPIQFGIGSFFYLRAWKSLRGVWRRGGEKKWMDRLLRWGSMDSLVALGTTVAWSSSIAFMALDVATPAKPSTAMASGAGTTYFDTSVFLILFILLGRWLEGISRQRTGDAIEALGKMKVSTGILYSGGEPKSEDSATDLELLDEKRSLRGEEVEVTALADGSLSRTQVIQVDFLEVGDTIIVPSGSSVPLDATLLPSSSSSNVDESSLTGEARPISKQAGDDIFAGTTNLGPSALLARVRVSSGSTTIDGIVDAVRSAMSHKASLEKLADRITGYFVPAIVAIACFTFGVWIVRGYAGGCKPSWLAGEEEKRGGWALFAVQFAVAVLVVACPCGIGLAAPTAQMVGTGLAASLGIVPYGGGEAFQNALKINAVVFDKTGTITKGEFTVADHVLLPIPAPRPSITLDGRTKVEVSETRKEEKMREEELIWHLVEATEEGSAHPISVGLRDFCQRQSVRLTMTAASHAQAEGEVKVRITGNEELPGRGLSVSAVFGREGGEGDVGNGTEVELLLGNEELLRENGVSLDDIENGGGQHDFVATASSKGHSIVFLALCFPVLPTVSSPSSPSSSTSSPPLATAPIEAPFRLTALFSLTDPPRPESTYVISQLVKIGITSFMCTGDNLSTAKEVARVVGIEESRVQAGVGPKEKGEFVRGLQRKGVVDGEMGQDGVGSRRWGWRRRKEVDTRWRVMFVGDGINDLIALNQSDVGVSMGTGAAVALTASEFCLLSSNLLSILTLLALARSTIHKIWTNFAWAIVFNTVLIPIAAGAFYDLGQTRLPPVWASLAMALSSVSVVMNSLLLRVTFRIPKAVREYSPR